MAQMLRPYRPTNFATRRIDSFAKRFGKPHLYFAYHAAFPLALTPDLLYRLWANFQQDIHGRELDIPWVAVADILLSPLCQEVGEELYEMEGEVRNQLLGQLKAEKNFSQTRIIQLSDFLLEYIQQQVERDNLDWQDFAQAQHWTALAYTQPKKAAQQLARVYTGLNQKDISELVRMESLVETLAEPLAKFQPLLVYAQGMGNFARDEIETAATQLQKLPKRGNRIQVAGVSLPIPEEIQKKKQPWTRRRFLRTAGLVVVGGGVAVGAELVRRRESQQVFKTPASDGTSRTLPLQVFEFEAPTVNAQGQIINRQRHQAQFFTEDLGNEVTLEMVSIPGGSFMMGAPETEKGSDNDERPQHQVTVKPFFMGKYPVTQAQWQAVADLDKVNRDLNKNPSNFKGDNRPVEQVSWYDAREFCARLSKETGTAYRLPSEAEWEYACRAGTTTPFHFGETITTELANYRSTETYASEVEGTYRQETTVVGSFPANAFGLHDVHGNVWEWCADNWHENYQNAPTDGSVWDGGNDASRLLRGGSWLYVPRLCRCAIRLSVEPDGRNLDIGFRVVFS